MRHHPSSPLARKWGWRGAGLAAGLTLAAAGCGAAHQMTSAAPTTTAAPAAPAAAVSSAPSATTHAPAASTTGAASAAASPTTTAPRTVETTAPPAPSWTSVTGTYVGGTADGGSVYIRSDGASRFLGPDDRACSTCSTADSPIGSIDFELSSIASTGSGSYRTAGAVTATSDGPWAAQFTGSPKAGTPVVATIAGGHLSLSFLTTNDVLTFTTTGATYTNTPPCTVAALEAANPAEDITTVTCSQDQEWAVGTADNHGEASDLVYQADFTRWALVDRSAACTGDDVPADLYQAACGGD